MERKIIIKDLKDLSDLKYKEFHKSLCPGLQNIIGVRVPVLRKYAKEILKKYDYKEIIETLNDSYYEETLLKGMIIGLNTRADIKEVIIDIKKFVPTIDNWATCDIFCSSLKITRKYKEQIYEVIKEYLKSSAEFELRFAIVMLIDYYIEEEYLEKIFDVCNNIKHDGYYVKMAVAWCISICLVKFYDKTLLFLKTANIDDFTYNKSIQKAIESYRITEEQKQQIKCMKK